MNDCPRQNPAYRSASTIKETLVRNGEGFCFVVTRMNDCPRRYAQKNAAYRSASTIKETLLGNGEGFCFTAGNKMNDCPRYYAQKNAAYRARLFCRPDKVLAPPSGKFAVNLNLFFRYLFENVFFSGKGVAENFQFCDR